MPRGAMKTLATAVALNSACSQVFAWENSSLAQSCLVFGTPGIAEVDDCTSPSTLRNMPQTGPIGGTWAVELDTGIAVDGNSNVVTFWFGGSDSTSISLGTMTTPVGAAVLDGKLYVACFGSWPTPTGDSGLAVIDIASKRLESTYSFGDARMHVHNVYAFDYLGKKEVFVATIGNPWVGPIPGHGLSRFDQTSKSFVLDTTSAQLSVRSAKQQHDGSIFVLTQEPAGHVTKLARLEAKDNHLEAVSQVTLPPRPHGGDGGADVVLGFSADTLFVTDRQDGQSPGKLYYYSYNADAGFVMQNVRDVGVVPRFTVALENGDMVSCNQNGNDLSVYKGLALAPTDMSIQEQRITTVTSPMFFMQTSKVNSASPKSTQGADSIIV